MQLTHQICWDRRRPASRSGSSRESWLRRSEGDMADPSVCERRNAPLSGYLDAALLEDKTVAPVKSKHPVDAERSLLPSRAQHLTAFLCFLVALAPVRGLLLFAKHSFVAAITAIACCHAKNAQVVFAIKVTARFCLPLCQNMLCQISPNDRDRSC